MLIHAYVLILLPLVSAPIKHTNTLLSFMFLRVSYNFALQMFVF